MICCISAPQHKLRDWIVARLPDLESEKGPGALGQSIGFGPTNWPPLAVVHFNNYRGSTVEASIAADSPRWCTRGTLFAMFAYPFVQLGVRRITTICRAENEKAAGFAERLGFEREGRLRHAFPDDDGIILGIIRGECRWIGESDGKQIIRRAA